jgi:SAM-dependent methyltransferase
MNLTYLIFRVIRHFMPENLVRTMLRHNIIVKPGLETSDPASAVWRYSGLLHENGKTLDGKNLMVFGYGGSLAIAVELLRAGCSHVSLCDLFPPVNEHINDSLLPEFSQYLEIKHGVVAPRSEWINVYHGDIRSIPDSERLGPLDLIVSTSVYEHLDDVDGITKALSRLLKPSGYFVAFIDLRDHYFKYPFEMLCYTSKTWKRWLNPTSNLNRYRVWDYRNILERYFQNVKIDILERDLENFVKAKKYIRPEYKSGNDSQDSITSVSVFCSSPMDKDWE